MENKKKVDDEPLNVLLVEDDMAHAELVRRSFGCHRVANNLYHVSDGEAALDYLFQRNKYANEQKHPIPQIVLLDLRLPKIDGLEVLRQIKTSESLQKIPVIILSTSKAEKDIATAYDYHANSYLVKPIGFDKLAKMMNDLRFYWLGWNCYP